MIIFGSCVSRDPFGSVKLPSLQYFARSSFASLSGKSFLIFPSELKENPSAFQRRMVECDMKKSFFNILKKNEDPIIIDFIDNRFDLLISHGGISITNSSEFQRAKLSLNGFKRINYKSDEFHSLWILGFRKFVQHISESRLVLINRVKLVLHDNKGVGFENIDYINSFNKHLDWCYEQVACLFPSARFIEYNNLSADSEHKWGRSPFHFDKNYEKYFVDFLKNTINLDKKIFISNENRDPVIYKMEYLAIDFYRVGKRISLPLPVASLKELQYYNVRGFDARYPWAIWLLWALEDRVLALGNSACFTRDVTMQQAVTADLQALAQWPAYREQQKPDLSFAHAVRTMWRALQSWQWLDEHTKALLHAALLRAVEDALPLSDRLHAVFDTPGTLLADPKPHQHLHNIPLIGTCALAMAAKLAGHAAAERLDTRVAMLFGAVLDLRAKGFTEGVSYDGYVLDFVADWLSTLNSALRARILAHPALAGLVEQVLALAVPGNVMATAPLGDVEPVEMPFVWSALAKLQIWRPDAAVARALQQCKPECLRADGISALMALGNAVPDGKGITSAAAQPITTNYALVLRSGYDADDVAVAMGLSTSLMGHIQCDNGSLVIGTRGRWWLDDPGYQQYLKTAERAFTVGTTAHNAPVLGGVAQSVKQPRLLISGRCTTDKEVDALFAWVDLTACYSRQAQAHNVRRALWLVAGRYVVVCDEVQLAQPQSLTWHWHGHPDLYWCMQEGGAVMVSKDDPDRHLHVFSPQFVLTPAHLHRLPGSRGQQTLIVNTVQQQVAVAWWVFSFSVQRPVFVLTEQGFTIDGHHVPFDSSFVLADTAAELAISPEPEPLQVTAQRQGDAVRAHCQTAPGYFKGELEYAFYLMVDSQKAMVQWYTPSAEAILPIPAEATGKPLKVHGFVREKANPDKKLMRIAEVQ